MSGRMLSEDEQLSIVRALTVTDPSPDPESDELIRYVARVCNAPVALLALVVWMPHPITGHGSHTHPVASVSATPINPSSR